MLRAAGADPQAADDQPEGCEAEARSCGDGARLSEGVGTGVAMSTCRGCAAMANSSPPVPWRSRDYRKATKPWKRVVAATPSSQEGIDGASPPLAPLCDGGVAGTACDEGVAATSVIAGLPRPQRDWRLLCASCFGESRRGAA